MADDLDALEPWLEGYLTKLKPAARRRLSLKIGQAIRRSNTGRIARNEEPDGGAMDPRLPRKPRKSTKSGRVKRKGKMFRRLRLVRNMKLRTDPEGVELSFIGGAARVASEHHYGLESFIGKTHDGRTIKARMTERRLLGFGNADRDEIIDAAAKHLGD
ncbi:phage virion morphogenesis protein [Parasphingorhabdus sp. JC815]|uniref:phage virion morphogenesis protein n=1 Tax=Parasphingorhabdus sp. JC815 TaxID=3232140 RepID=UPI0034577B12